MLKRNYKNVGFQQKNKENAQTAIEYMLLSALVMFIAMYGFQYYLPLVEESANLYYNKVTIGISGKQGPNFCDTTRHGSCN